MNDIKLLRDHIVRLQTMITELGKKPSTVIRFVDDNTIPQQRQINTVYYNMSNDTVLVYNDMLREWKTMNFNGGSGSVDWDDITNKPTEFPPESHGHISDGVTITGTGTTADPFVAVGVETTLLNSNELKFDKLYQYGSIASPRTGDITLNFTDAKLGILQTMFHDALTLPAEILSNSKFVILQGYYEPDSINRITFEIVDITSGSEKVLVTIIPTE